MKLTRNSELISKLQELLIGKYFLEEDYQYELNALVSKLDVEVNTCDFDFDRIYNAGYGSKEDWNEEYIASIEVEYLTDYDYDDEQEASYIKIVDIFN